MLEKTEREPDLDGGRNRNDPDLDGGRVAKK